MAADNETQPANSNARLRRLGRGAILLLLFVGVSWAGWEARQKYLRTHAPVLGVAELERKDGRLVVPGTGRPFTGWIVDRYPEHNLKSRSWVSDGQLNGLSEGWYTNGVLQIREFFVDGASTGPVVRYYPGGQLQSEATTRQGKFEGAFRRWHENGVLAEQVTFERGQPHGQSRSWFPSGFQKAEVTLEAGRVVTRQYWKDGEQKEAALTAVSR